MDISKLTPLINPRRVQRFETSIIALQKGLAEKHIWNVDFNNAKDTLSRGAEEAIDASSKAFRELGRERRETWESKDLRWAIVYHPSFLNTPGAYKKLQKYTGKEGAEFDQFLSVLKEIAEIAELVKAVKPFIEKGRKPSENPVQVDYSNTGVCPVCLSRQKLGFNGEMVAHGYTLHRNWGGRNGMCFGHGYKAWELSPEGAIAYLKVLKTQLQSTEKQLDNLQNRIHPELTAIVRVRKEFGRYENEKRTYLKGTAPYEKLRQNYIYSAESDIRLLQSDIKTYETRIQNWTAQSLMYGGAETQERWKSKLLNK